MSDKKIKILAVETHYLSPNGEERLSAVDWYRIINPLTQVAKSNKDISVDFIRKIVSEEQSVDEAYDDIGENYDILYTSYMDTPKSYAYIKAVCEKYGMKHIMDMDDNIFAVDDMNPAYIKYHPGSEPLRNALIIIDDVTYMSCSTNHLANLCESYRKGRRPEVLPNFIDPKVYKYDKSKIPDNGDDIVIGYQGSSTHYTDFFKTDVMYAIRRIMLEFDNVKFYTIGMVFDDLYNYFDKDRLIFGVGDRDHRGWRKKWQALPIDIGIAPLVNTSFNRAKSSIKYYEYALREIPAVYSWVEPYINVVKEHDTGYLAQNENEWYEKLKILVQDEKGRKAMARRARKDVMDNYTIQKNYKPVEDYIRRVHAVS